MEFGDSSHFDQLLAPVRNLLCHSFDQVDYPCSKLFLVLDSDGPVHKGELAEVSGERSILFIKIPCFYYRLHIRDEVVLYQIEPYFANDPLLHEQDLVGGKSVI